MEFSDYIIQSPRQERGRTSCTLNPITAFLCAARNYIAGTTKIIFSSHFVGHERIKLKTDRRKPSPPYGQDPRSLSREEPAASGHLSSYHHLDLISSRSGRCHPPVCYRLDSFTVSFDGRKYSAGLGLDDFLIADRPA